MASDAGVWVKLDEASVYNNSGTGSNLLYNGAMQVHQRGTSALAVSTASRYLTVDRWNMVFNSGSTNVTVSGAGVEPAGEGFRSSSLFMIDSPIPSLAATDQGRVRQILEGQDVQMIAKGTTSAKSLTLSFWVKCSTVGTYVVELYDNDNMRFVCQTYEITVANKWQKVVVTFPPDQMGMFEDDNGDSLYLSFWLWAGSNYTSGTLAKNWSDDVMANRAVGQTNLAASTGNYWEFTGVQLEVGETATSFEHKKFGAELLECQRYYQKSYHFTDYPGAAPSNGALVVVGMANTATTTGNHNAGFRFESRMRTTPTVTSYRADNGASGELMYARKSTPAAPATASVTRVTDTGAAIYTTNASGLVAGDAVELLFHYTAEAEL